MVRALGLSLGIACVCASGLAACGDDDSMAAESSGGCTTDIECKGDRVCEDGKCVDPSGGDSGDAASGAKRDGGTAVGGRGGSGGKGSGSGGRSGGTGGSMAIDDPELEAACGLDCMARHEAGCEMNIGSLDQCMAQCLVIDEANQGYCLEETTARYACLASGGYSCVSGYPQPKATCLPEAQALSTCTQLTPCRAFCARAAGNCAPEGDACVTSCMEEQNGFEDAICGIYYTQLLACWGQDLSCVDGKPSVGKCGAAVAEVADCVGRRNEACDGFCWAADVMGCGSSDCTSACMAKTSETYCGSYYRNLIECSYGSRELAIQCSAGTPEPDAVRCMSQLQQYQMCMQSH